MVRSRPHRLLIGVLAAMALLASAVPSGSASFALYRTEGHAVGVTDVSFGLPADDPARDLSAVLGPADCAIDSTPPGCAVSLGQGGSITVRLDPPASADGSDLIDIRVRECCIGWELDGPFDQVRVTGRATLVGGAAVAPVSDLFSVAGVESINIDLDAFGFTPWHRVDRLTISDANPPVADPPIYAGPDIDAVESSQAISQGTADDLAGVYLQMAPPGPPDPDPLRIIRSGDGWRAWSERDDNDPSEGFLTVVGAELYRFGDGAGTDVGWAVAGEELKVGTPPDAPISTIGYVMVTGFDSDGRTEARWCSRPTQSGGVQHQCVDLRRQSGPQFTTGGADSRESSLELLLFMMEQLAREAQAQQDQRQAEQRPLVYLATTETFPDALAVASITGLTEGFTLLVDPTDPAGNADLLTRADPREIVIIGGQAAIPDTAIPDSALPEGTPRQRLGGTNRFDTAALLARTHYSPGVEVAYVATGANYPDALAGGAVASITQAPILLVEADRIPAETATELARLQPGKIVVLGGTAVISDTTAAELYEFTDAVQRLSGPDRIATATAVSSYHFPNGAEWALVANGEDFRNAEAAAGAAWAVGGPLLLVRPSDAPQATLDELNRLGTTLPIVVTHDGELTSDVIDALEPG